MAKIYQHSIISSSDFKQWFGDGKSMYINEQSFRKLNCNCFS